MVESLCNSSKRRPNSLTAFAAYSQDQRRYVGGEQFVQHPTYAVVIQESDFVRGQPQQVGRISDCPLAKTVDRLAGKQQIAKQNQQGFRRRKLRTAVFPRGKASLKNSSRRMRRSSLFTKGKAPTVAERNTDPPTLDTGGESSRADDGFDLNFLDDIAWTSCFCKPSSAHRSGSTTVPRGRQIVTIGDSSQEVNVQRSPKSRIAKTRNLTYEKSYQRKLSATRLTSMAHAVSIFIPAPQTNWTLPRHEITPYNSSEKKINPRNDALCSGHNEILQCNRHWKFKDNHIEMCGK